MDEKELLNELLVDEKTILRELISKAKELIGIDQATGRTIYVVALGKLRDSEKILLALVGRHFASRLGKTTSSSLRADHISRELGVPEKTVSNRLSELVQTGLAERTAKGEYSVIPANLSRAIEAVSSKRRSLRG